MMRGRVHRTIHGMSLLSSRYGCIADAWGNNDVVLQCWKL